MALGNEILLDYVRYARWATATTLDACSALSYDELHADMHTAYPTIWITLVHQFQADSVWWSRFQQKQVGALSTFDPGSNLYDLRTRWLAVLDELLAFVESCDEQALLAPLTYRNTRGEAFEQPLWQALMHMVNHGTLHRGQVLVMFRQLDRVPTGVDLIHYYRRSLGG